MTRLPIEKILVTLTEKLPVTEFAYNFPLGIHQIELIGTYDSYNWEILALGSFSGEGKTSNLVTPQIVVNAPGCYHIHVTAKDGEITYTCDVQFIVLNASGIMELEVGFGQYMENYGGQLLSTAYNTINKLGAKNFVAVNNTGITLKEGELIAISGKEITEFRGETLPKVAHKVNAALGTLYADDDVIIGVALALPAWENIIDGNPLIVALQNRSSGFIKEGDTENTPLPGDSIYAEEDGITTEDNGNYIGEIEEVHALIAGTYVIYEDKAYKVEDECVVINGKEYAASDDTIEINGSTYHIISMSAGYHITYTVEIDRISSGQRGLTATTMSQYLDDDLTLEYVGAALVETVVGGTTYNRALVLANAAGGDVDPILFIDWHEDKFKYTAIDNTDSDINHLGKGIRPILNGNAGFGMAIAAREPSCWLLGIDGQTLETVTQPPPPDDRRIKMAACAFTEDDTNNYCLALASDEGDDLPRYFAIGTEALEQPPLSYPRYRCGNWNDVGINNNICDLTAYRGDSANHPLAMFVGRITATNTGFLYINTVFMALDYPIFGIAHIPKTDAEFLLVAITDLLGRSIPTLIKLTVNPQTLATTSTTYGFFHKGIDTNPLEGVLCAHPFFINNTTLAIPFFSDSEALTALVDSDALQEGQKIPYLEMPTPLFIPNVKEFGMSGKMFDNKINILSAGEITPAGSGNYVWHWSTQL